MRQHKNPVALFHVTSYLNAPLMLITLTFLIKFREGKVFHSKMCRLQATCQVMQQKAGQLGAWYTILDKNIGLIES